ncbi:MAG: DUF4124 domain-containing protein [Chromatiaceae bacterium]
MRVTTSLSKSRCRTASLIVLFAASTCMPLHADMYRWVDENGRTVYSQSPPPDGQAVKLKAAPPPPPAEVSAAQKRLQRQIETSFDDREERKRAAEEQAKKDEAAKRLAENCAAARKNLETLQNLGPRMIRTSDGEYRRLSEEEVAAEIRKTEEQIAKHCK